MLLYYMFSKLVVRRNLPLQSYLVVYNITFTYSGISVISKLNFNTYNGNSCQFYSQFWNNNYINIVEAGKSVIFLQTTEITRENTGALFELLRKYCCKYFTHCSVTYSQRMCKNYSLQQGRRSRGPGGRGTGGRWAGGWGAG